jgi:hypothetical protein
MTAGAALRFCRRAPLTLVVCCAAAGVEAQTDPGLLHDHAGVGVGVGYTTNGDADSGAGALDVSVHADLPLHTTWRVRAEIGTARWAFGPADNPDTAAGRSIRLTRGTVGIVHSLVPKRRSSPGGIDVLGGVGLYHYGLSAENADATQLGLHAGVAFDYALQTHPVAWGAELRMHAIAGPGGATPIHSDILFVAAAALTARITFP